MSEFQNFWAKVFTTVNPIFAWATTAFSFLVFPEKVFVSWFIAVWIVTTLDLLSKMFAIFSVSIKRKKRFGKGIVAAFKEKRFSSDIFFHKTIVKIISYLMIQIIVGLSMQISPIGSVSIAIAAVIYNFVFWREAASIIENCIEAGADGLQPLLFWMKKKRDDSLKMDDKEKETIGNAKTNDGSDP